MENESIQVWDFDMPVGPGFLSPREYVMSVERGEIPDLPIAGSNKGRAGKPGFNFAAFAYRDRLFKVRDSLITEFGLHIIIDKAWIRRLAEWIGDRTCLEIMAGAGWLAKGLFDAGVDITAADDFSWEEDDFYRPCNVRGMRPFDVLRYDAVAACRGFADRDILICSWPPKGADLFHRACNEWGPDRTVVFIGEGQGGHTADDNFFERFREQDDPVEIPYYSWQGIRDRVRIGTYNSI